MFKVLGPISSMGRAETGKDIDWEQRQKSNKERQRANMEWRPKNSRAQGGQGVNPWGKDQHLEQQEERGGTHPVRAWGPGLARASMEFGTSHPGK